MVERLPALYALRTEPVYRYYIWGGTRLSELLGKPAGPQGTLAESWEVGDDARVAEGAWQGKTLREIDEATNGALSGDAPHYPQARLPLLIKLSGAAQDLSVQIHPTDEQALRDEPARGYPGKSEMYVILDAEPGAGVYWGLKGGVTAEQLRVACQTGKGVPELINFVRVKAGDVLFSPSGVVHALGKGIVFCEVQQNSDITYRLYDWGRVDAEGKPRQLHLDQGLAVLDMSKQRGETIRPLAMPTGDSRVTRTIVCACCYFAVELIEFKETAGGSGASSSGPGTDTGAAEAGDAVPPLPPTIGDVLSPAGVTANLDLRRSRRTLRAVIVLDGEVAVAAGAHITRATKGQSVVVPASLPESMVGASGAARVVLAYEPDLAADIVGPLRGEGYTAEEVAQLGDVS